MFSIFISGTDLKYKRVTHKLDVCSAILISGSSFSLESNSHPEHSCHPDLQQLKHWGWTHKLDHVQPFLSVVLICSKAGEPLTSCVFGALVSSSDLLKHWRVTHLLNHVHCSPSVLLICSNTEDNSHPICVFIFPC